jgi:hypothetical protein
MWARSPACSSAAADLLTTFHNLALLYLELRKMKVKGQQSLAVVDNDTVTFKVQEARQQDCAVVHCINGRSGLYAVVQSEVRTLRGSIEDALRAEDVGSGSIDWG